MTDDEREQLLQEAWARPLEDKLTKWRREHAEQEAQWAAARAKRETAKVDAMSALEARLDAKYGRRIADQRELIFEVIGEAFKVFYDEQIVPLICEPYEKKFRELTAVVDTLRAELKQLSGGVEAITLPSQPAARRMQ